MNIVAIILVICSSVGLAFFFIRKEIRHCAVLAEAINIVEYISGRAEFFKEPLSDIMKTDVAQNKNSFENLCVCFGEELKNGITVPDAWLNTVRKTFDGIMEDYEQDILIDFGQNLCRCSSFEIENLKAKTVSDLNDLRKTAIENKNTKTKSMAAVTVSAGVIIVLMFA